MVRWVVGSILHGGPIELYLRGARCSSVVRAFVHGAMGAWIDFLQWIHRAISRSSQEQDVAPW